MRSEEEILNRLEDHKTVCIVYLAASKALEGNVDEKRAKLRFDRNFALVDLLEWILKIEEKDSFATNWNKQVLESFKPEANQEPPAPAGNIQNLAISLNVNGELKAYLNGKTFFRKNMKGKSSATFPLYDQKITISIQSTKMEDENKGGN